MSTAIQARWVCPHSQCVCFPIYTAQALGCSAGNYLMLALGCMHSPGLSCLGSGSWVLHKGTDLVGLVFSALPRSKQLRRLCAWQMQSPTGGVCVLSPPRPSCSVFWVYNRHAFSGVPYASSGELIGCDPPNGCRPSRIPTKPACSLVDDASLGL